jgi:8-oxo-dGTP diphosphatase
MLEPGPIPVFGQRLEGEHYIVRPSAYAIIADGRGHVATVITPLGLFLPGGGIEAGETPGEAVVREAREEAGLLIRPLREVARAIQFSYSKTERCHFEKRIVFLRAVLLGTTVASETDHELVWQPPAAAAKQMWHESHGWVLQEIDAIGSAPTTGGESDGESDRPGGSFL